MAHVFKPYATAGVAIVGASLIAVTPAVAPVQVGHIARDVALTAGSFGLSDLIGPYISAYNQAANNVSDLLNSHYAAPDIGMTQLVTNLSGYLQTIVDDPSTMSAMTDAIQTDLKNVWSALTLIDADQDTINDVIRHTMDSVYLLGNLSGGHEIIFSQVPGFLPADQAETLTPIINFIASPMSAVMLASISPWIAPGVALTNSLQDFSTALTDGDTSGAFQELLNIPAHMFNASLNGATLDLGSLLPAINDAGFLPDEMEMTHLDFAFGGWLSVGGHVTAGPMHVMDGDTEIALVPAAGGSIFNSIGFDLAGVPIVGDLHAPSDAVGPLGAWLGLSQVVASQLGWGYWDGKDPEFHIPALNPGTDIEIPTIPEDYFDDGGAGSGVADSFGFGDLLSDFLGFAG